MLKQLLFCLLSLPVLSAEAPAPVRKLQVHLTETSELLRDPWCKTEWKPCHARKVEWSFCLSCTPRKGKKPVLDAVLEGFQGTWVDKVLDDPKAPALDFAFGPSKDGMGKALGAFAGTKLQIELDPKGGVAKVTGMTAAAAKHLAPLLADKASKPAARLLEPWLTDEAWKAMLSAAFLPAAGGKVKWSWPLPWPTLFEEKLLPPVPVELKLQGESVEGGLDSGSVNEDLQFPSQPGYHSLGTEQKAKMSAAYVPEGLSAATLEASAYDRWDNYRPGSMADRFARKTTITLSLEAVP